MEAFSWIVFRLLPRALFIWWKIDLITNGHWMGKKRGIKTDCERCSKYSSLRFIGINFYLKLIKFIPLIKYSVFFWAFFVRFKASFFLCWDIIIFWWKIDGFFSTAQPLQILFFSASVINILNGKKEACLTEAFFAELTLPVDTFYIGIFVRCHLPSLMTFW